MDITKLNKDEMLSNVSELLSDIEQRNEALTTQTRALLVLLFVSMLFNLL